MSEKKIIRLPESELEIMQAIWALKEDGEQWVSAGVIMKRFPEITRLKLTTVLTLITRLHNKGFISTEKIGRANSYTPIITSEEYRRFATEDFVKKVYMNDRMDLINKLFATNSFSADELEEIKQTIKENENNNH